MSGIDRKIILDPRHIAKQLPDTTPVQRLLRRECDRAYLPSHFKRWALLQGYHPTE